MYVNAVKHQKSQKIYFGTVFLRRSMCACVKNTCWKFNIYFSLQKKKSLKLTTDQENKIMK